MATASLEQRLSLETVMRAVSNAEYRPEQFPGLIYRLKKPRASILLFSSGKMVCTGVKSAKQAKTAITKVINELKMSGIVILNKPLIQVQNMVASGDLHGEVDLENSAGVLRRTLYEPDQFPGLIHRMEDPQVMILLFTSGKLVCAGAKNEEDIHRAVLKLKDKLVANQLIHLPEISRAVGSPEDAGQFTSIPFVETREED